MSKKAPKKEPFRCNGCGRVEALQASKSHWCDCDKTAPFRMVPVSVTRAVARVVRGFKIGGAR